MARALVGFFTNVTTWVGGGEVRGAQVGFIEWVRGGVANAVRGVVGLVGVEDSSGRSRLGRRERGGWLGGRWRLSVGRDAERARGGAAARRKIRRYGAANRRTGGDAPMGDGCHDPGQLRADLAAFFRGLRGGWRGAVPYVWVPQWHPGGHGLHAHFAVGRYVPRGLIDRCWGHGFVHIKLLGGLPVGSGELAEARQAAGIWPATQAAISSDTRRLAGGTVTRSRRASSRRRSCATGPRPRT